MPYRVFFSCATSDAWIVRQCVRMLEEESGGTISAYVAKRDLRIGSLLSDSLRTAIAECDAFIVLLSPGSRNRDWILLEIGAALMVRKTIISVLLYIDSSDMPEDLKRFAAVDLNDFDRLKEELIDRARGKKHE